MGRFKDAWATGKFILQNREKLELLKQKNALSQLQELSPELAVPAGTREIFDALKLRRGQETGRWLREMAPKPPDEAIGLVAKVAANDLEAIVILMDALFKEFEDLVYAFNQTAVGSDLLVSHANPTLALQESHSEEWFSPVSKTYQGRMMTRQWALVVRGRDNKVSVLLLPSVMLLAYTAGQVPEDEFPPFMEISRSADKATWTIGGEAIPLTAISPLAKELLGDLIRVSSGVMAESELFSRNVDQPKLGENLAVGFKRVTPESAETIQEPDRAASNTMSMLDACDIVDGIVDSQLKYLYIEASKLVPTAENAEATRKQISAIEAFRLQMLDAFQHYMYLVQPLSSPPPAKSSAAKLLQV